MTPNNLLGDELYQINLILWMLQPSTGRIVRPILARAGVKIKYIEAELPLAIALKDRLVKDGLSVSDPVSPDFLLVTEAQDYVLLECKRAMFGSSPEGEECGSQVKQARSLLLQIPQMLTSALGLRPGVIKKSFVTYLAPHDPKCDQIRGVLESSSALKSKGYRVTPCGLLTLTIKGKEIMLAGARDGALPPSLKKILSKGAIDVQDLGDETTDPRPLYIIPWMPGGAEDGDLYGQTVFGNRILSAVAAQIGPLDSPCEAEIEIDQVLESATLGYFTKWKKKASRKALRDNAKSLIKSVRDKHAPDVPMEPIGNPSKGWKFSIADDKAKSAIVEGLRKWQASKWNTRPPLMLFEERDAETE